MEKDTRWSSLAEKGHPGRVLLRRSSLSVHTRVLDIGLNVGVPVCVWLPCKCMCTSVSVGLRGRWGPGLWGPCRGPGQAVVTEESSASGRFPQDSCTQTRPFLVSLQLVPCSVSPARCAARPPSREPAEAPGPWGSWQGRAAAAVTGRGASVGRGQGLALATLHAPAHPAQGPPVPGPVPPHPQTQKGGCVGPGLIPSLCQGFVL